MYTFQSYRMLSNSTAEYKQLFRKILKNHRLEAGFSQCINVSNCLCVGCLRQHWRAATKKGAGSTQTLRYLGELGEKLAEAKRRHRTYESEHKKPQAYPEKSPDEVIQRFTLNMKTLSHEFSNIKIIIVFIY